ncbi:uncharacterized protein LAESUDRAFT_763113 [Laetiporus sulphureus 93-53]|uniref:Uncharacterized protein n=1 Tax=Laetiporus sulphureus 93-53 TaxID=1314785 RepID=A0A165C452_9APHY|nr:uncharacterized protein LAESUDRAFT_763113 [Laetiporus sulphureus 93-53]KZT02171.1 hypothetical protein LAESUDRAFT_763113 [Laetiporus sulphureus 93-53]
MGDVLPVGRGDVHRGDHRVRSLLPPAALPHRPFQDGLDNLGTDVVHGEHWDHYQVGSSRSAARAPDWLTLDLYSLCSLTALAMMAALPHTYAVLSVEFMVKKLYVNSFNARNSLRCNGFTSELGADLHLRPISGSSPSTRNEQKWAASPTTGLPTEIAYTGMAY